MPKTASTLKENGLTYFASKHDRCKMKPMLITKAPVIAEFDWVALHTTARASKSKI